MAAQITDEMAAMLVALGQFESGADARLHELAASACHDNVQVLLRSNPKWTRAYGFALSDDNCWRVHSWCKNIRGRIVETTMLRDVYFGLYMPGQISLELFA